ncbi:hypothetical protein CORC01_07268 [Colletotrichum orchidophilum]|uniref:Uncharacterized protein n=1 Tax=Colletotrichum orchidophilum TaxID=1209926 RepID=A0A1G4B819_9PEZI|nr:uncharacterized protein CORC01_07268 [Colletotrichum orchidophilum]OHE97486.1 hypothetical protein CORC01_07268 [Colletotrichum orchidophilum]
MGDGDGRLPDQDESSTMQAGAADRTPVSETTLFTATMITGRDAWIGQWRYAMATKAAAAATTAAVVRCQRRRVVSGSDSEQL